MKTFALLFLPIALGGCAKAPPQDVLPAPAVTTVVPATAGRTVDPALLGAYHWKLERAVDARGQRIDALFVRADQPLQLDFSEGRLIVGNACNRMNGRYTLADERLRIERLASTMMACTDPKLMALDQEIGNRLQASLALAVSHDATSPRLTLTSADGDVLTFRGDATAQTRFGGPGETVFLEVAARTKPCPHPLIPDRKCLQVRELHYDAQGLRTGTPGAWHPLYQDIEGYTHTQRVAPEAPCREGSARRCPARRLRARYGGRIGSREERRTTLNRPGHQPLTRSAEK